MSRVPPTPVEILVDDTWIRGTVRTCEVTPDGQTCSSVVSYGDPNCTTTARVTPDKLRTLTGQPGCPAPHRDETCRRASAAACG